MGVHRTCGELDEIMKTTQGRTCGKPDEIKKVTHTLVVLRRPRCRYAKQLAPSFQAPFASVPLPQVAIHTSGHQALVFTPAHPYERA